MTCTLAITPCSLSSPLPEYPASVNAFSKFALPVSFVQKTPGPVWLNISIRLTLKFVALGPKARFTAVRAEGWEPLKMREPPVVGHCVPV
jgi:hypothetical protein